MRQAPDPRAPTVVVMGVSGAGKTTVAGLLAAHLGCVFLDADDLHPAANLAKMRAGVPLTDADRAPWLDNVARWIDANPSSVVACSALRRRYRTRLRAARTPLWFVHLNPPPDVLRDRVRDRVGHFMPAALLPDQLATLESLGPDEPGVELRAASDPAHTVEEILAALATPGSAVPS